MRRLLIFVVLVISISGCDNKIYPRVEILTGNSGILKKSDGGKLILTKAKDIPYRVGNSYYWRLAYRSNLPSISYTQEIKLSAKGVWNLRDTDNYEISEDGTTVKIYTDNKKNDGFLIGTWTIAEGDPSGKVTIVVTIEKDAKKIFEYELVKDEN
jgi:hypothetical protein